MPILGPLDPEMQREVKEANTRFHQREGIAKAPPAQPTLTPEQVQAAIQARHARVVAHETEIALALAVIEHNATVPGVVTRFAQEETEDEPTNLTPAELLKRQVERLNGQRERGGFFQPKEKSK